MSHPTAAHRSLPAGPALPAEPLRLRRRRASHGRCARDLGFPPCGFECRPVDAQMSQRAFGHVRARSFAGASEDAPLVFSDRRWILRNRKTSDEPLPAKAPQTNTNLQVPPANLCHFWHGIWRGERARAARVLGATRCDSGARSQHGQGPSLRRTPRFLVDPLHDFTFRRERALAMRTTPTHRTPETRHRGVLRGGVRQPHPESSATQVEPRRTVPGPHSVSWLGDPAEPPDPASTAGPASVSVASLPRTMLLGSAGSPDCQPPETRTRPSSSLFAAK